MTAMLRKIIFRLFAAGALAAALAGCDFFKDSGSSAPPTESDSDDAAQDGAAQDGEGEGAGDDLAGGDNATTPEPSLPHGAPGILQVKTARFETSLGVTDPSVVSPLMRFPVQSGPAFLNSQIFMFGGGGYDYGSGEVYENPNNGQENNPANFDYPWRDNFCEVRTRANGLCAAGVGHHGQDIRPATCDNGANLAVAPEDGFVRRVGATHLVEIYGNSGLVYKFLHLDRPLEPGIEEGAPVVQGQPIGRISNKTGSVSRSTTVHLHFEIWHGLASGGVNLGAGPLPPYSSLVEAYLDLIDDNPDQFDPITPPADIHECLTP